jgi:CRP/FNR family transcriptional regulator, polysaccharide utilization system transcription regulator
MMKKEIPSCENCATRNLSIFANIPSSSLNNISDSKKCVHFKKGQELFHEGVNANGVYCIHSGKLKFARIGVEGREQIIRFGKTGDIIGYRSLLSKETVSASVVALSEVDACYIPKDVIFKMISSDTQFTSQLLMNACHELGEAGKIITNLAQKSVRERLAEALLILHATFGLDDSGFIDVNLKREEIASVIGTATETVIRFLSEFKSDGHIELSGARIKLLHLNKLADIGSVYDY